MNLKEKLYNIQQELKAPKGQYNKFGNFKYRSCEDILEAVKPLLKKYKVTLVIEDELQYIGDRYYVKAITNLIDIENDEVISNSAYAREEENKKGMDGSQITGASSSYARKYALNGLLAIDDTKDSDATNDGEMKATPKQVEVLAKIYKDENLAKLLQLNGITKLEDISFEKASELIKKMNEKIKEKNNE